MKKVNFILKNFRFILCVSSLFIFFIITYVSIPKFLNFSTVSIKEKLKKNNNIDIKSITRVDYKIFPTPRLSLPDSNFTIGKKIAEINNSELEIILSISQILNFKKINYKKLLINNGFSKINLNNINQLLDYINKSKKEITFKENNITFYQNNNFFFKISNAIIKINPSKKKKELNIKGFFLDNKISIKLNSTLKNKNNLTLKIPGLDIVAKVFFEKNDASNQNGFFNLEVFNNFLKFSFVKEDNIKLSNGFIRTKLTNTSFRGEIDFKPIFFSTLYFETANLDMKKLFLVIQKFFFSERVNNLSLLKKINGIFNFKSNFEGSIINRNGEILFKDFIVGKKKSLYFDAKIIEFGKKGNIQFNLKKKVKYRRDLSKNIEITGILIPSNSKIIFKNFLIDGNKITGERMKEYENKFKDELIQDSISNIFNESKIEKYFKNLF